MYHIAICDDDSIFCNELQKLLEKLALEMQTQVQFLIADSGDHLIAFGAHDIDLLIIDMEMPGCDGFETVRQLQARGMQFILAFCTGIRKPLPEYFDVHPFCYIMKQYGRDRITNMLRSLLEEIIAQANVRKIRIMGSGNAYSISIHDILYIDKAKGGSRLCLSFTATRTLERNLFCEQPLKQLYLQLCNAGFAYAHRSYIINLRHIKCASEDSVLLSDDQYLSISRSCKKSFHEAYLAYFGEQYRKRKS